MRKSRVVITEVDETIFTSVYNTPISIFQHFDKLEVPVFNWSAVIFLIMRNGSKLDISFFEDAKDYFLWYTRVSINSSHRFESFIKDNGNWIIFTPPTLIGPNLKTKLR